MKRKKEREARIKAWVKEQKRQTDTQLLNSYTNVRSVQIDMTFVTDSGVREVDRKTSVYSVPSKYAAFDVHCFRDQCIDGGFDLSDIVFSMLQSREVKKRGRLTCQGRIGPVGSFTCLYELHYEITVEHTDKESR